MLDAIRFDVPAAFYAGLPALLVLLALMAARLAHANVAGGLVAALVACRGIALLTLVFLLARPVTVRRDPNRGRRTVAVLLDRSRSMALVEDGETRYARALGFARHGLLPALEKGGYKVETFLFDEAAVPAPLPEAAAAPEGAGTDLGGAVHHAVVSVHPHPLAVVALTDGAATRSETNPGGVLSLIESSIPFVGIGFGRDTGVPTLSLQRVAAPSVVPPRQAFRVSAQLQSTGAGALPGFDLVLLRDGRFAQSRRIDSEGSRGSRFWSEGFDLVEPEAGVHEYTLEIRPPAVADLVTVNSRARAAVQIAKEKDFRVLFVQGALTWDFKFIGRALRGDASIRVTGLSRTSKQSLFRQNLESAGELEGGFPADLSQIAPYRVVVLSELKPSDLTPAQQELIARFCGELGGGVLMLGGSGTFDASWQGSRLEELLPVTFDSAGGVSGLDRPFHLRLSEEARRSPLFRLAEDGSSARVWDALPTFTQYGRVLAEKPAATVWARHDEESGPRGKRILMASQPYGGGISVVICVQNFWRWRLAKDADPSLFDRFWQQLFRFLGQSGRQEVSIQFLDQELRTQSDIRALVERRPHPESGAAPVTPGGEEYTLRVRGPSGKFVLEEKVSLVPLRPVPIRFRAREEGIYTVEAADRRGVTLASQPVEIRDVDRELERTARDMENLRQWAGISGGLAVPAEECADPGQLVARLKKQVERAPARARRQPVGMNGWGLAWVLAWLCGEWALRRRWELA